MNKMNGTASVDMMEWMGIVVSSGGFSPLPASKCGKGVSVLPVTRGMAARHSKGNIRGSIFYDKRKLIWIISL